MREVGKGFLGDIANEMLADKRRVAQLEFMLSEIVYLHTDGTVRVSWKPDVDLTD